MFCIDTNIFVEFLRGNKEIIEKFNNTIPEDIFLTPITLCELFQGAYLSDNVILNIQEINEFTESFNLLDFDREVCEEFGKEYARLKKIGKMIPEEDLMIASFVKYNNLIFLTRDKKHFENLGIKIEIW